jgi:ketosteroid isomerase-like protein
VAVDLPRPMRDDGGQVPRCSRGVENEAASTMEDAMASTRSEIKTLLDSRLEACRAKDIDRLMSLYSPDIVYFDVVPPLQGFIGTDAVRRNFLRWFGEYEGPIGLETRDLYIAMSRDVAFAHMLHLDKKHSVAEDRA